ncbi:MAG: exodeoxyribonuclease VII small subunit [Deltaproteobacteria bacterium]|nr:exodeoxyribonuclease VII small subunit [Deltaproteobacteria bacterium]
MTPRRARSKEAGEPDTGVAEPRFEQALAQLESLVHKLEIGELDLEQALGTFEEGVALAKLCSARLEAAELRISKLEAVAGETVERELELGDDE